MLTSNRPGGAQMEASENQLLNLSEMENVPFYGILGSLRYISSGSLSTAPGTPNKRTAIQNRALSRLGKRCNRRLWAGSRSTCRGFQIQLPRNMVEPSQPASMSSARTSSSMYGTDCIPANPEPCESPSGITAYPP